MRQISLPFRLDGYGAVATTSDLSRIWADRVRSVIATSFGERVMRPDFGCPTPVHLFRGTESIETVMDVDHASAFADHLPQLTYRGIIREPAAENGDVSVEINYAIPGRSESLNSVNVVIEVD